MSDWAAPPSGDRVPTLTEVVDLTPLAVSDEGERAAGFADVAAPVGHDATVDADAGAALDGGHADAIDGAGADAAVECAVDGAVDAAVGAGLGVAMDASGAEHGRAPDADFAPDPAPPVDPQVLVALSLAELQPRLDMLLESRLREALAPALARAAEGLISDARGELAAALNELVQDAVRRALQRHAGRAPSADTGPPHRP